MTTAANPPSRPRSSGGRPDTVIPGPVRAGVRQLSTRPTMPSLDLSGGDYNAGGREEDRLNMGLTGDDDDRFYNALIPDWSVQIPCTTSSFYNHSRAGPGGYIPQSSSGKAAPAWHPSYG
jgi:hypothetical protein